MTAGCLDETTIARLLDRSLTSGEAEAVAGHVDGCSDCRRLLSALADSQTGDVGDEISAFAPPANRPHPLDVGDAAGVVAGVQIGRYELVRYLGRGSMGAVFVARDPDLGREIAIKLLRLDATLPDATRTRLLREAKALAKLSHPNVVAVYDTGSVDDQLFIAMELVASGTLREWLKKEHTLDEIVAVMTDAARGLAAIHACGLVHRDIKPANILVDASGRVRIGDFGLARALDEAPTQDARAIDATASPTAATQTGALVGTPSYMAPEQFARALVDARSDQFSFCVTYCEALYGERPFVGDTVETLAASVAAGLRHPLAPTGRCGRVPRGMRSALERGLAVAPAARHDSIEALHAALVGSDRRRRRRRTSAVLAAAAFVATAAIVAFAVAHRGSVPSVATPLPGPIQVLVADFRNDAGEPMFQGAAELAFATALEEAPLIAAYPRAQARRAIGSAKLDDPSAHAIAMREKIYAIATGSIVKTETGYSFAVRVIAAGSNKTLVEVAGQAANRDQVLPAIAQLAVPVRIAMGDGTAEATQRTGIAKATAGSLEAMHQYAAARDLMDDMNPAAAARALERVLELDPSFDVAYTHLAASYLSLGEIDKAREAFGRAFSRIDHMGDRQRFETRGMYYAIQGEPTKALDVYERMLERFPDDRAGLRHLAQTYAILNQHAKALEIANRILARDPGDLRERGNAAMYSLSAGDFERAAAEETALVALQPESPGHRWVLAQARFFQGQRDKAIEAVRKMQTLSGGDSQAAVLLGEIALAEGRSGDALAIVAPAIANDLEHHDTFGAARKMLIRARAQLSRGDQAGTNATLEQALAVTSDPIIAFDVARSYIAIGKLENASALAVRLGARIEDIERAHAKVLEGEIALASGHPSDAIRDFLAAQHQYDVWIAAFDLGRAYLAAEAFPEAHEALSACWQRRGELGDRMSLLPLALYYLGRSQEGLKSPTAVESYRAYVKTRGSADADPLLDDARRRLAALTAK